jgi:hypothetical protein
MRGGVADGLGIFACLKAASLAGWRALTTSTQPVRPHVAMFGQDAGAGWQQP